MNWFYQNNEEVLNSESPYWTGCFRFSDTLQTEILEIEFNEFSLGKPSISESDFTRILLRYTVVHSDDYRAYLDRVAERIPEEQVGGLKREIPCQWRSQGEGEKL